MVFVRGYCVASDLLCTVWQVIVVDYVAASPTHFPKPHLLFQAPPTFQAPPSLLPHPITIQ